jgi:hypothetical protein
MRLMSEGPAAAEEPVPPVDAGGVLVFWRVSMPRSVWRHGAQVTLTGQS